MRVFDHTLHETNICLQELMEVLGPDRQRAYDALRATLYTPRDRLTVEESTDLGAQLPMLIRGIYYEGWKAAKTPEKVRSRQRFLDRIDERLQNVQPMNAEVVARTVFAAVEGHVSPGQKADVYAMLPRDIRTLWPSEAAQHETTPNRSVRHLNRKLARRAPASVRPLYRRRAICRPT